MRHTRILGILAAALLSAPLLASALVLEATSATGASAPGTPGTAASTETSVSAGATLRTNCDGQAKPALECPAGYSVGCNPTGGYHWGCVKDAAAAPTGPTVEVLSPMPAFEITVGTDGKAEVVTSPAPGATGAGSGGAGAGKVSMGHDPASADEKLDFLNKPEVQAAIYVIIPTVGGEVTTGSQKKGGNVEFEWKVEEGESAAASDMFLKFPPIKGESSGGVSVAVGDVTGDGLTEGKESGEKGGTEDINIGVGELQEGKPKEIVIVGSKVRALSDEQKAELKNAAPVSAPEVKTEADLALFAAAHAADDRPMEEVAFNYGKIIVKYQQDGKLLWVIPHSFVQTTTLDTDTDGKARVKVKFPWYSFLLSTDVSAAELEEEAAQANDKHKEWIEILSVGAGASLEAQASAHAQAFSALSNVLKTKHDSVKNSVGNVR